MESSLRVLRFARRPEPEVQLALAELLGARGSGPMLNVLTVLRDQYETAKEMMLTANPGAETEVARGAAYAMMKLLDLLDPPPLAPPLPELGEDADADADSAMDDSGENVY
jgi:hypothetical protein